MGMFDSFNEDSRKHQEGSPAHTEAVTQQQVQAPPTATQTQGSALQQKSMFDDFNKESAPYAAAANHDTLMHTIGKVPESAIPDSPLNPFERGRFGNMQDGVMQHKYLEDIFGKGPENVQFVKMDDKHSNWVVRVPSPDGKGSDWRQVDPAGLSDIPTELMHLHFGKAYQDLKQGITGLPGGIAQTLGEHGLDIAGATLGGTEGGITGAELGAPFGPIGSAVGGVAGGIIGAGIGAAGTNIPKMGARDLWYGLSKLYGKATGNGDLDPYAKLTTPADLPAQVASSFMFGAMQEAGARATGLTGDMGAGAVKAIGKVFGDSPMGKYALGKLVSMGGGVSENAGRTLADFPNEVSSYIPQAAKDVVENTGVLQEKMKSRVNEVYKDLLSQRNEMGGQYEAIEEAAKGKRFDPFAKTDAGDNQLDTVWKSLQDKRYIDQQGNIGPSNADAQRDLSGTNGAALKLLVDGYQSLKAKGTNSTYQGLGIIKQNLNNLMYGVNKVTDGKLMEHLRMFQDGLTDAQQLGLEKADPELSKQFAALNDRYGPTKDLLKALDNKQDPSKVNTFLKQIMKDDGSYNSTLLSAVSDITGKPDVTQDILNMKSAQEFTPFITKPPGIKSSFPFFTPGQYPRAAAWGGSGASVIQNIIGSIGKGAGEGEGAANAQSLIPVHDVYKSMPPETKANISKSPTAIDQMARLAAGSVISEQQTKQSLLKQSGVFQQSQFGNGNKP